VKILVTGASGFIGGHIVDALAVNLQAKILATGRSDTGRFRKHSNVIYFTHDLREELPQQECDVCIHCAGLADDHATREEYTVNNVIATRNIISAVRQCGLFVFISSASVYNFGNGQVKREDDADINSPTSLYGKSKFQAEVLVRDSGIPSLYILRPRAVYGPGDRVLLPRILGMIRKEKMMVPSTLAKRTSLTNILNLCDAVGMAIGHAKHGVHIYNIADKRDYDLKTVLGEILKKKTGRSAFIEIPTSILRALSLLSPLLGRNARVTSQSLDYITQDSVMSIANAESELNYVGQHEFHDTIDQLIG